MVPGIPGVWELVSEFKADGISAVHSKNGWYESVNVEALSEEAKKAILEAIKNKLGFSKACEALSIAKSSLYRYLPGERKVPAEDMRRLAKEEYFRWLREGRHRKPVEELEKSEQAIAVKIKQLEPYLERWDLIWK